MSRSFWKYFTHFPLLCSIPDVGFFIGSGVVINGSYAILTANTKVICLNQKYTFTRNGYTEFMVIDENGNHYNVNNSLYYLKWNSIEDWHKLNVGDEVAVKYYGWRIPVFGMFPNIVSSLKQI